MDISTVYFKDEASGTSREKEHDVRLLQWAGPEHRGPVVTSGSSHL